jgi:hypothetical protein
MARIEIWEPKYSTNSVLIASHRLAPSGVNTIVFTKAKHLLGGEYQIESEKVRTYPKQPNGAGEVYVVPMDALRCIKEPQ